MDMLKEKPYWEQTDSCHVLVGSDGFKSTIKSLNSPKGKNNNNKKTPKSKCLGKKHSNTENIEPEDESISKLMRSTIKLKEYKLTEKY